MADAGKRRRAKGEGSLRLMGRVWWAGYTVDGRRVEENTGQTTRAKAAGWLRHRLEEVRQGGAAVVRAGETRLEDLVALIRLDYRSKANRSPATMEKAVARLRLHFGDPIVADLRHDVLARHVDSRLASGAGRGTVRAEMAILRRMLRLGQRMGLVAIVPPVPMPAEAPPRQGFLEREELEAILAHVPEHYRPAFRFAYLSGWRFASEVRSLQWADVDNVRGLVTLPAVRSKNGESRVLPYRAHPEMAAILEGQRDATRAVERETRQIVPHVFHRAGLPLSPSYNALWRLACKKAKLPGVLVHDLRRSSTRNLSEAGVSPEVIMQLQGHRTRAMFTRYRIVSTGDMAQALGQLSKAAAPAPAKRTRHRIG